MSDTFIKIVQDIKNNVKGTVLGAKIEHVAGNLVEVKIFSLAADAEGRVSLWNRLTKVVASKPYKSLEPYTIRDSKKFYGRDRVLTNVLSKMFVDNKHLVVVYGAPGIGKTSMIEAGLAPLIIQQGGLLVSVSNYDNPTELIQQALKGLTVDSNQDTADEAVGDDNAVNPVAADGNSELTTLIEGKIDPGSLILVLDQFELVFESTITKERRQAFINDLQTLFAKSSYNAPRVIIVARDEAEVKAGLADFQRELPDLLDAIVEVPLLDYDEAIKALNDPVGAEDRVQFDSQDVVEMIAKNLASLGDNKAGVYPPHLQIVCGFLYDEALKNKPYTITRDLLARSKFAQGIIARFLELRLDNQLSNVRVQALELLVQLGAPKRERWVSPGSLTLKADPTNSNGLSVEAVLEKMVAAKLLYRHHAKDGVRYGFIDAGMVERIRLLAGDEIAEQQRAGDEMERMWQSWLARDVFATSEQLEYSRRNQAALQLEPVQILFLLRSAMELREDTADWLKLLSTEEGGKLISALENGTDSEHSPAADDTTVEFAWELLSVAKTDATGSGNGTPPPRFKSLSETAANGPDDITRATAAVALMSKDVGSAVGQIDAAIGDIDNWTKRVKDVKLRSAMVEALETVKGLNSRRFPLEKRLIFFWLVFRRAYHRDAARILRITASGALCSGLLVGIWGGLLTKVMMGFGSDDFAIRFTNAAVLGGALALGLALISPLLEVHKLTGQFTGSPARAALIICTIIFGGLHWALHLLQGTQYFAWNSLFLISMGFVFGSGIGLGVMTDFDQQGSVDVKWNWRYISAAAIIFFLIPLLFTVVSQSGRNTLHLNIVTGADIFATNLNWLSGFIDALFMNRQTARLIATTGVVPLVYQFISAIDSIVTGLFLILGFKLGVRLSNKL